MLRLSVGVLLAPLCLAASSMAAEHVIVQKNKTFSVAEITIQRGDTILFKNEDGVAHNAFSTSKEFSFNLNMQLPKASTSVVFENEGTIEVRCVIHPAMKLIVNVKR
jgi:plastocyanin